MAKYMVQCANAFFRTCRNSGVFLTGEKLRLASEWGMDMNETQWYFFACHFTSHAGWIGPPQNTIFWYFPFLVPLHHPTSNQTEEAYARVATLCYHRGWKIFKFRPKYHLGCHLCRALTPPAAINPCCCLPPTCLIFKLS